MINNLIEKKEKFQAKLKYIQKKQEEYFKEVEKLYKSIDHIKLLYDTNCNVTYRIEDIEFDNDLRNKNELENINLWLRKDYNINIFLSNFYEDSEIKIGSVKIVIFNIENFKDRSWTLDEFDLESDTFILYEEIFNNNLPNSLIKEFSFEEYNSNYRKGTLLYISNIEIHKKYRNKGYGEYTLKYIEKIVNNLFNIQVASIVLLGEPFIEYYMNKNKLNKYESFLDRLEFKKTDIYYYKVLDHVLIIDDNGFLIYEKIKSLRSGKYMYGDLKYKKQVCNELKQMVEDNYIYKIEQYNEWIETLNNIINDLENINVNKLEINRDDSVANIVIKKYIEIQNKNEVAKYLNQMGFRIKTKSHKGERQYTSKDINEILVNDNVLVDVQIKNIAYKICDVQTCEAENKVFTRDCFKNELKNLLDVKQLWEWDINSIFDEKLYKM